MKKPILLLMITLLIISALSGCKGEKPQASEEDFNALEEVKISDQYEKGRTDFTEEEQALYDIVESVAQKQIFSDLYKDFPAAYVTILDEERNPTVGITVSSDGEGIIVEKGYNTDIEPFAVVEVTAINIQKMEEIFADDQISEAEQFLISNLFFKPVLQKLLLTKEVRYFSEINKVKIPVPNFCTLENPLDIPLPPDEDWTKLTVIMEDGQYKVIDGQSGKAKMHLLFDPNAIHEGFKKMWAVIQEPDFEKKVALYEELQDVLLSMAKKD